MPVRRGPRPSPWRRTAPGSGARRDRVRTRSGTGSMSRRTGSPRWPLMWRRPARHGSPPRPPRSCSLPEPASTAPTTPARWRPRSPPACPRTRVIVVNDTLAALRAGTPDGVGLAIPVSTGGNVIGRGSDGRVTDRGHGIFGGGYVLGALAARAARRGGRRDGARPGRSRTPACAWLADRPRRPEPEVARLGAAVVRAAERGDPLPARMVDRWCGRVTRRFARRWTAGPRANAGGDRLRWSG